MENCRYSSWPLSRVTSAALFVPGVLVGLTAITLAACGGGQGGGEDSWLRVSPAPALRIGGTVAVGQALAGVPVQARCAAGGGSTVSAADGRYQLALAEATLPCVLQARAPAVGGGGGAAVLLHSLAVAGAEPGELRVSNITPLTELVLLRLARGPTADFFADFAPPLAQRLQPEALKAAQSDVSALLASTVDLSALPDLIATPLRAATPAQPGAGDAQDRMLDELAAKLGPSRRAELQELLGSGRAADGTDGPFLPRLSIQPAQLSVLPGGQRLLMADINYPPQMRYIRQPVSWQLLDAEGGQVHAISGVYEAPSRPGVYRVQAQRDDYPEVKATVKITVAELAELDRQAFSGVQKPRQVLVRDASALDQLWAEHRIAAPGNAPSAPPPVDFEREMVAGVFLGLSGPSGCDGVAITGLRREAQRLRIEYRHTAPAAGVICTTALSSPAHLVRLARSDLPLDFVRLP